MNPRKYHFQSLTLLWTVACSLCLLLIGPSALDASKTYTQETDASGEVHLSLEIYQQLLAASQNLVPGAPAKYALSAALLSGKIATYATGKSTATIVATVQVQVLEDGWTLVPLMPNGTSNGPRAHKNG